MFLSVKKNGREGSFLMDDFYKMRINESIYQIGIKLWFN